MIDDPVPVVDGGRRILVTIKPLIQYEVRTAENYFKTERRGALKNWL